MICDSDDWIEDVVVATRREVCLAEVGSLHDEPAILSTNVEARAYFVGETGTVKSANIGVLRNVLDCCLRIVNRCKDESANAPFEERIPVLECEAIDVGSGDFLETIVDGVVIGGIGEMLDLLAVLVVQLKAAARGEEITVAKQASPSDGSV